MSDDVFPTLPGLKWGTVKTPIWSTKVLTAASGRETRGSFQSYPRWRFTLSYEFLRGANGFDELQDLVGFFNQRGGSLDNFLYRDPADYQVSDQALGVGDSSTTEFRFVRSMGGFVEPVLAPENMWLYLDRGAALGKWRVSNEPRTNAFGRSEDVANSYWTKEGGAVTSNTHADPSGLATFDLFSEDATTGSHDFYRSTAPTGGAGVKHCLSWYVKPAGRTVIYCRSLWAGGGGAEFTLTGAGTVNFVVDGTLSAGIRALSNGIYRVWIVVRPTSAGTNSQRLYLKQSAGGSTSYTGDGVSGVHVGWMQHEALPEDAPEEPTEYISSPGGLVTTVPAAFTLGEFGYFTFAAPPPAGVALSWSGTFWFRVRFTHDSTDIEQFLQDLYSAKKVEFISEK
jgi:hypothetical protein